MKGQAAFDRGAWCHPEEPARAVEKHRSPTTRLITLVVPDGEVGVVRRLRSQAVVDVLTVVWIVLVHRAHCLDQLREGQQIR